MRAGDWRDKAVCVHSDPDLFAPESYTGDEAHEAKDTCAGCPVRRPCLAAALAEEQGQHFRERAGIRGGTTPRQRWRIQQREAA
ncbi:WhiB family transcriptional regulator [Streptomyces sp. NPDC018019]|uniref:WhiB family transcriptional regulator n=1 Tax=Streptomyces sp. NPDC018019 TaxID=3365030 RepID=UPI00378E3E76